MSAKDDKLPSYPSGFDVYPENYRIKVPSDKMQPLGFLSHSDKYKTIYQEISRRPDSLLDENRDGRTCFCINDYFNIYLEEVDGKVFITTEEGDTIETDNIKEMHKTITEKMNAKRDRDELGSHTKKVHDLVEAAGAVMYDHDVIGETSVTDLVNAMEGKA